MADIDTSTAAIEALLDGVTEGPWQSNGAHFYGPAPARFLIGIAINRNTISFDPNMRFIVAARQLVPSLAAQRDAAIARAEQAEARVAELRSCASRFLNDVDDLIAQSRGVAGLHLNDDLAEWGSLTTGGEFEEWLKSLECLRAALSREGGE